MTNCSVCYKTKSEHSQKLWALHQQSQICGFCHKNGNEHSSKLWNMHQLAINEGRFCSYHKKREKLYPITLGYARTGVARVCKSIPEGKPFGAILTMPSPPNDMDLIPIYMSCTECGLYLGSDEEDYADILDGTCFVCFKKMTGQAEVTDSWI
mgnify:CR=1 FL=1